MDVQDVSYFMCCSPGKHKNECLKRVFFVVLSKVFMLVRCPGVIPNTKLRFQSNIEKKIIEDLFGSSYCLSFTIYFECD